MANAIKWISTRAKQIRKAHPKMEWRVAMDKASAQYRREKPKTSTPTKKTHIAGVKKRTVAVRRSSVGAAEHVKAAKHVYEDEYGVLAVKRLSAPTATEKKRIDTKMSELRKMINKIDSLK